jgi:hydroxymethylbilane synthase
MEPDLSVLRIGTRSSRLALAQAELAATALAALPGAPPVTFVQIRTKGDALSARRPTGTWASGDGQFTTELERALLAGEIDVAVHSLKDLPTAPRRGLVLAAILERGDPRDCLATSRPGGLRSLPFGARVATSSVRRAAQLAAVRSDIVAVPIRGNVDTRLRRLDEGAFDGLLVAAAAIDRLGLRVPHLQRLPLSVMLPAPGQAAIALQVRADADEVRALVSRVDHPTTRLAVVAERALLRSIGGGCLAPLGALATVRDGRVRLQAAFETADGFRRLDLARPATGLEALVAAAAARLRAAAPVPA